MKYLNSSHLKQVLVLKSLIIIFFFIGSNIPPSLGEDDEQFTICGNSTYECGDIRNVSFPFWGGDRPEFCGHPGFELSCEDNESSIQMSDIHFRVLNISQSNGTNSMKLAWADLENGPCSPSFVSFPTALSYGVVFTYPETVENLTLYYGCPASGFEKIPHTLTCSGETVFYANDSLLAQMSLPTDAGPLCPRSVRVPINGSALDEDHYESSPEDRLKEVTEALKQGWFEVTFPLLQLCRDCDTSGGRCGYNITTQDFSCFCRDWQMGYLCPIHHAESNRKVKIFLGTLAGVMSVLLFCIMVCCYRKIRPSKFWSKIRKKDQDIEAFIRSNGQLSVKRYRFSDVKKMTKSFKDKLGQGGYGEVYKGNFLDGRVVAVKLLKSSKGNGEDFVNEVASISRTSHVNIVTLLGFSLEGRKRALIYEFMPNGSLEKFVYKDNNALQTNHHLEWDKLLQIATGIARGLEYLHRGCNTKILHLDIKPHNILLDENFRPKISDFGLSKHCPDEVSTVMLLDVRGTIGYIAPEVLNRNFGEVSSKSDVYSYGMMILEMVGGRKNIKVEVSRTSQIYFPDWIYKHLVLGNNMQLWDDMSSEENEVARKMIIVGLWCIQANPLDRPSMSKVIEMLEGSLEALQIPPKPTFSCPKSPERISAERVAESSTSSLL